MNFEFPFFFKENKMTTAESSTDVLPGFTNERHPDIFNLKARPKVTEKKPGQLPEHMIKQFFEDVNIIFRFEINFFLNYAYS